MNKLAKGAIAGAAGIVLLLGGAGTFAFWNSSAGVSGGTVVAGNLQVVNDGTAGVWEDQTGATIDIANYRIVPGDVLTYTDDLTVTAVGDHLQATLALGPNSVTPSDGGTSGPDYDLAQALQKTAVLDASGAGITGTSPGPYTVAPGTTPVVRTVTVTVTLTFPQGTAGQYNSTKLGSVDLSNMDVTLTQIFS